MLQHRGQDSAGMVTSDGAKFHEHKANGLVSDVFGSQALIDKLTGVCVCVCGEGCGVCAFVCGGGHGDGSLECCGGWFMNSGSPASAVRRRRRRMKLNCAVSCPCAQRPYARGACTTHGKHTSYKYGPHTRNTHTHTHTHGTPSSLTTHIHTHTRRQRRHRARAVPDRRVGDGAGVCARVCACACVCVCARARAHVCVCICVCVRRPHMGSRRACAHAQSAWL